KAEVIAVADSARKAITDEITRVAAQKKAQQEAQDRKLAQDARQRKEAQEQAQKEAEAARVTGTERAANDIIAQLRSAKGALDEERINKLREASDKLDKKLLDPTIVKEIDALLTIAYYYAYLAKLSPSDSKKFERWPVYWKPTDTKLIDFYNVLVALKSKGTRIGVSFDLNFAFALYTDYRSEQGKRAPYVLYDINPNVTEVTMPFMGYIISRSATRSEFLSLISGRQIRDSDITGLSARTDKEKSEALLAVLRSAPLRPDGLSASRILNEIIYPRVQDRNKYSDRSQIKLEQPTDEELFLLYATPIAFGVTDHPLWIAEEEYYQKVRQMWLEGVFVGMTGDLSDRNALARLRNWLEEKKAPPVSMYYVSNVPDYLHDEQLQDMYNGLGQIQHHDNALLLLTSQKVQGAGWVESRALPFNMAKWFYNYVEPDYYSLWLYNTSLTDTRKPADIILAALNNYFLGSHPEKEAYAQLMRAVKGTDISGLTPDSFKAWVEQWARGRGINILTNTPHFYAVTWQLGALGAIKAPADNNSGLYAFDADEAGRLVEELDGADRRARRTSIEQLARMTRAITAGERANQVTLLGSMSETLIKALSDGDEAIRIFAAGALGNIGDRKAGPALIALLDNASLDKSANVRLQAAKALGKLKDTRAIPALISRLKDRDYVAAACAEALGKIADPSALSALEVAGKDEEYFYSVAARKASVQIRDTLQAQKEALQAKVRSDARGEIAKATEEATLVAIENKIKKAFDSSIPQDIQAMLTARKGELATRASALAIIRSAEKEEDVKKALGIFAGRIPEDINAYAKERIKQLAGQKEAEPRLLARNSEAIKSYREGQAKYGELQKNKQDIALRGQMNEAFETAIKKYMEIANDAAASNSWRAYAFNYIGLSYDYIEDYDKAIEYFVQAVRLQGGNAAYRQNLAGAYHGKAGMFYARALASKEPTARRQNYRNAISAYELAIQTRLLAMEILSKAGKDTNADSIWLAGRYRTMGNAYWGMQAYGNALRSYIQAASANPGDHVYAKDIEETLKHIAGTESENRVIMEAIGKPAIGDYFVKQIV
ncbi:MAG: HEAT repeat domain-containing protein, partial [Candidatus Omnitrophica bacterium]|nr:HEAT repeat domain-containing protein [Candidatus Omnitrophota bacterium]